MKWSEVDRKQGLDLANRTNEGQTNASRPVISSSRRILMGLQGCMMNGLPFSTRSGPLSRYGTNNIFATGKSAELDSGRLATAHGFRSSFRDWCSEQGYARDLAERALAHTVQNKVEAAYHRTDLLDQRRPMMDAWAIFVDGY